MESSSVDFGLGDNPNNALDNPSCMKPNDDAMAWQNQERCRAILECQEQIKYWKSRYTRLKAEHKRLGRLQALRSDAAAAWPHLSPREKLSADNVLEALRHSNKLPRCFQSITWWENSSFCGHAEVWRARLARPKDVCQPACLTLNNSMERLLLLPENNDLWFHFLALDPSLLYITRVREHLNGVPVPWLEKLLVHTAEKTAHPMAIYEAISNLLEQWENSSNREKQRKTETNSNVNSKNGSLVHRIETLRNCRPLMQALWKRPVWGKTKRTLMSVDLRNDKEFCLKLPKLSTTATFPADALASLSQRLRADMDVVLAYCQRHGGNLAHASYGLRRHYHVIATACQSCPRAIIVCLQPSIRNRLWNNEAWVSQVFEACRLTALSIDDARCSIFHECAQDKYAPGSQIQALWRACPPTVKSKRNTLVAAARVGINDGAIWESKYAKSPDFWIDIWRVDEVEKKEACLGFCRPYWHWTRLSKRVTQSQHAAAQWLYYHGIHILQLHRHRKDCVVASEGLDETALMIESVTAIVNRHPLLVTNDTRFLECVMVSRHPMVKDLLMTVLVAFGGVDLQSDQLRPLIREGCRANGFLIAKLPIQLQASFELVQLTLQHRPEALTVLPMNVQVMYPDLVAQSMTAIARKIRKRDQKADATYINLERGEFEADDNNDEGIFVLDKSDDDLDFGSRLAFTEYFDLYEYISEDLWQNRQVALAWIRAGGSFLHDDFPETFDDDEEFALAIAEFSPADFMFVSERLLSDTDFMRKVVEKDGSLLRDAGRPMPFDVILKAFANNSDMVKNYSWTDVNSPDFKFLVDFAKRVRRRLLDHESFSTFLLGFVPKEIPEVKRTMVVTNAWEKTISAQSNSEEHAVSLKGYARANMDVVGNDTAQKPNDLAEQIRSQPWTCSPVVLLDCGKETSDIFKRMISVYVGSPVGEELCLLRRAGANLQSWGF